MKYLKLFKNDVDYQNYVNSDDYISPNVSYVEDTDKIALYNYTPPISELLDIVYYDGSSLKTIQPSQYNTSLGTAVGVTVIPSGMLPDGKARFIALKNASTSSVWGGYGTNTSLTDYTGVFTTDNASSTTTGFNNYGYLPSDYNSFTGATSYVDPKTKYLSSSRTPYIPSPYLADGSLNPAYCEVINRGNALSDFNGKSNTDVLVGLGTDYSAANAAKNYAVDGVDIDWYLPAAGELGFLVARFAAINESIAVAGGVAVPVKYCYLWSSTESSSSRAYSVDMEKGLVSDTDKKSNPYVRSFATL